MMTTIAQQIIYVAVASLRPHPENPRGAAHFKRSHPKMAELITSVGSSGVLEPLLVHTHPTEANAYEIIAGHRRHRAAELAGLETVPVIVRDDLAPEQVFTTMLAENIQRADVDPFEEARLIATMFDRGYDLAAVAEHFGKSYGWAHKRSRLAKLSKKWLDRIEEDFPRWTIEHAVLLARYDTATQEQLCEELQEWSIRDLTVEGLARHLADRFFDVAKAPWKMDDAELLPDAGACAACTKRSGCQRSLFDDIPVKGDKGKDLCLDKSCWDRKAQALFDRRLAVLTQKHPELVRVSVVDWSSQTKGALGRNDYVECPKSDKHAKAAIAVDGPNPGRLLWVRGHEVSHRGRTEVKALPGQAPAKTLAEKREALAKRRSLHAFRALHAVLRAAQPAPTDTMADEDPIVLEDEDEDLAGGETDDGEIVENAQADELEEGDRDAGADFTFPLPEAKPPVLQDLVAWASIYGVTPTFARQYGGSRPIQAAFDRISAPGSESSLHAELWIACQPKMDEALNQVIAWKQVESEVPRIVARCIGVDLDALLAQATAAIPEPKAWRSQHPEAYTQPTTTAAATTAAEATPTTDDADAAKRTTRKTPGSAASRGKRTKTGAKEGKRKRSRAA